LKNDVQLHNLFSLCDEKKKFVYEVSPIFGDSFCVEEMEYWVAYNCIQLARMYDIKVDRLDYVSAREAIEREAVRRKAELKNDGRRNIR